MCSYNLKVVTESSDWNPILVHLWSLLPVIHFTKKEAWISFSLTPTPRFYAEKYVAKRPSLSCDRKLIKLH